MFHLALYRWKAWFVDKGSFSVQDVLDQVDKAGREVLGWLTT